MAIGLVLAGAAAADEGRRNLLREAFLCDRPEPLRRALETLTDHDYLAKPRYPVATCRRLPAGSRVAGPFDRRRLAVHGVRGAFVEDILLIEFDGRRGWIFARDLAPAVEN